MLTRIQDKLTYSNLVATLALFLAIGGTSYAAATITSSNVKNESLTGKDIRNKSLTGSDVRDGSLGARDFARGQLPAGPAGPKGDTGATGPQGPAGAKGDAAASGRRIVLTAGAPEQAVASPAGLGEIRANCNTNSGGSLVLYYANTSAHAVDMWQESVRDGSPDARDLAQIHLAAGAQGGFVNTPAAQRHVFDLSDGTSAGAEVTVAGSVSGNECVVQAFTISG